MEETASLSGSPQAAVPSGTPVSPGTAPWGCGGAAPALLARPPPPLVFAGMLLTIFFTPLFLYVWHFLWEYVFPEVPPAESKGSAVSSVGLWQRWLEPPGTGHVSLSEASAIRQTREVGYLPPCCPLVSTVPVLAGDQYCGGRLEKPSGSFQTPNWPERDYPAGVTCSWHIVAPKNQVRRCHRPAGTAQLPWPQGLTSQQQPLARHAAGLGTETTKMLPA